MMWYVKDHFKGKVYFSSSNLLQCSNFANRFNKTFKFAGQRMFKFHIHDFSGFCFWPEDKVDVNKFTLRGTLVFLESKCKYSHPLAIKNFDKVHRTYISKKVTLIKKLCYKYHVWPFNEYGRKCDGFDF